MLTLEQKNTVLMALNRFVKLQAQLYEYDWSHNYLGDDIYSELIRTINSLEIDFNSLSASDAHFLGFVPWEEDPGLYLIPLHLYKCIPNGTVLTTINGKTFQFDKNCLPDNDNRSGMLGYGIKIDL